MVCSVCQREMLHDGKLWTCLAYGHKCYGFTPCDPLPVLDLPPVHEYETLGKH